LAESVDNDAPVLSGPVDGASTHTHAMKRVTSMAIRVPSAARREKATPRAVTATRRARAREEMRTCTHVPGGFHSNTCTSDRPRPAESDIIEANPVR
jgi:hypothetical protein